MESARVRWSRGAFRVLAWLFLPSVVLQVALAGVAVMADASYWSYHRSFVHVVEAFPVFLALAAALGRPNAALVVASVLGWFLIGFQYALAGMRPSPVAGLHVVNALAIFALSLLLVRIPSETGPASWVRPAWRQPKVVPANSLVAGR